MINGYIKTAKFTDFIDQLFSVSNEALLWEFWLHKNTGKSWEDFKLAAVPQEADLKKLESAEHDILQTLRKGVLDNGVV